MNKKRMFNQMLKTLEELRVQISTIHSQATIDQEITDSVNAVVANTLPALVSAQVVTATAVLQKEADDTATAVSDLLDQLTAGNVAAAQTIAQTIVDANAAKTSDAPAAQADAGTAAAAQ